LGKRDRFDLAQSYLEYLRESERSIHVIKSTESRLRDCGLFEDFGAEGKELEQELAARGSLLGKRARAE
jgi:hypothetical protein